MNREYKEYLRNNIKYLRKKNKLTQSDLSKKVGIAQTTISDWENGVTEPNVGQVLKLCDLFRLNMDELLFTDLSTQIIFKNAKDALRFIQSQPLPAMGGYNLEKMSEQELIDFAEELQQTISVVMLNHRK